MIQAPETANQFQIPEQHFLLPGHHTWQQFKALAALMEPLPGVRLVYLDGCIELLTRCVLMPSRLEAKAEFLQGIQRQ